MTHDVLNLHLHNLERRLDSECSTAVTRILHARTMADVVRATSVTIPPEIRAVARVQPSYRRMHATADQRLERLLTEQLAALKAASLAEAEELHAGYRRKDWQALRGAYATLYRRAEAEAQRLLHAKREQSTSN
jgi:hypothetical protein